MQDPRRQVLRPAQPLNLLPHHLMWRAGMFQIVFRSSIGDYIQVAGNKQRKNKPTVLTRALHRLASPRLTLYIVAALILFSLVGALVPQRGLTNVHELHLWQTTHPTLTRILAVGDFFSVFHSPLFLLTLAALAVNTLACTIRCLIRDGFLSAASRPARIRQIGFLALHLSVLICITGGMISAAYRKSGHFVVTEGQIVFDQPGLYPKLAMGPFRDERHGAFQLELLEADIEIEEDWYPVAMAATIRVGDGHTPPVTGRLGFNRPFTFGPTTFTLREIGYSPQIVVTEPARDNHQSGGFVSLRVWGFDEKRKHYDFLPLPGGQQRLMITLLPSHTKDNEQYVKTGEAPVNPAVLVRLETMDGSSTPDHGLSLGESTTLDGLHIEFRDLRQWATFQVVNDPGYRIVCIAFITGIAALGLRYFPDITDWIKESQQNGIS